jgi:hypothetical protein
LRNERRDGPFFAPALPLFAAALAPGLPAVSGFLLMTVSLHATSRSVHCLKNNRRTFFLMPHGVASAFKRRKFEI